MVMGGARRSLERIASELEKTRDSRDFLLGSTREIVGMCSQAIIGIHRGDEAGAAKKIDRAEALLKKYRPRAKGTLARYLVMPEQEFVEASALLSIRQKRRIRSQQSMGVMPESYVLGLLDCVGELKRMFYDRLREGHDAEAGRIFGVMEDLYHELQQFALYDKVVADARRKIDVNRRLVDDVRVAMTEEARRAEITRALES